MKIYDIEDKENCVFAFEINNTLLSRSKAVKIVKSISDVQILKSPKNFSCFREEVFCEFELAGRVFHIWEPFGDSSRYWIGPKDSIIRYPEIDTIKNAFLGHKSIFLFNPLVYLNGKSLKGL